MGLRVVSPPPPFFFLFFQRKVFLVFLYLYKIIKEEGTGPIILTLISCFTSQHQVLVNIGHASRNTD